MEIPSLTTLSAALTFENLPDDKKKEAFLQWLSTQSDETKVGFLDEVKQLVNDGITLDSNYYHYVIIGCSLTELFLQQEYIDFLNGRVDDLIGRDRAMVVFVNRGSKSSVAPLPNMIELIEAIEKKRPLFVEGICFKLDGKRLRADDHTPMYFNGLQYLIDGMIETIRHFNDGFVIRAETRATLKELREAETRISFDFEITFNGETRKVAYFAPRPK